MKKKEIKLPKLYYIIECCPTGERFACDNKFNRIYELDGRDSIDDFYIFIDSEIEKIIKKMCDKVVLLEDDMSDYQIDKYNIIPLEWYFIDDYFEEMNFDEEYEQYRPYNEDFQEAMEKKYGSIENYWNDIKYRCLQEKRIVYDYVSLAMSTYEKEEKEFELKTI